MNIGVFLSQYDVGGKYAVVAAAMGQAIAKRGHALVFGGTDEGLMRVIAQATHESGGRVIAVIREPIKDKAFRDADEIVVVPDAKEMNLGLIARSGAVVVLPGGIGTLNELTEVVRMKKNGNFDKPLVVVNADGFYSGLEEQVRRMAAEGFLRDDVARSIEFVNTSEQAIERINSYGN